MAGGDGKTKKDVPKHRSISSSVICGASKRARGKRRGGGVASLQGWGKGGWTAKNEQKAGGEVLK